MNAFNLDAISPIDGRYSAKTLELKTYFSEAALIRYRVQVEIEYFIALCEIPLEQLPVLDESQKEDLRSVYHNFSTEDAAKVKEIEATTNHDVKAVEYFVKSQLERKGLDAHKEFIHFGLTSQDINNTAIPLSLRSAMNDVYVPQYLSLTDTLSLLAKQWEDVPMLAYTHGQPASPTRLGKEINVFVKRLAEQFNLLNDIPSAAKFGGATGNLNAHHVAYPEIDWQDFANSFVQEKLGLYRSFPTTQIEHYDHMAALFDALKRINTVLIDLNRDIWSYISMNYFKQKINKNEIGSSAMPHKVNPIDFENAEGNLGLANALFAH
ncbi:MAG: adenylosuccinate lyase, partial [Flavobacteriaceae bacterium]|nr:adenylosuccinate lyase [Flavobacteriaceae bacterium]